MPGECKSLLIGTAAPEQAGIARANDGLAGH
jgi:hypothetical protein